MSDEALNPVQGQRVTQVDISPIGLAISLEGAALGIIAVFLPFGTRAVRGSSASPETASSSKASAGSSSRWQSPCAVSVFVAYRGRRRTWGPIVAGGFAVSVAILTGSVDEWMTLCATSGTQLQDRSIEDILNGNPGNRTVADPGIGVYAAGVAGLLM